MFSRLNWFVWILVLTAICVPGKFIFFLKCNGVLFLFFLWKILIGKSWIQKGRIVGGSAITIKQAPFQALILSLSGNQIRGICGGSIIKKDYVLTAAHCTQ